MAGKQLTSTKTHNRIKGEKISIIKLVKRKKSVEREKTR